VTFPTEVGYPKDVHKTDVYVGDDAHYKMRGMVNLHHPIEHGIITNWDEMERIWRHAFINELHISPEEHPVLLTQVPLNPTANKEKTAQIMFETFHVPAMSLFTGAVLSFMTCSNLSPNGVVLSSGEDSTFVVPIKEWTYLPLAVKRIDLGGRDLTKYMLKLLSERYRLTTSAEHDIVRDIKERLCYVSMDLAKEISDDYGRDKELELPDGQTLIIRTEERIRCPEALFQPSLLDLDAPGVHQAIFDSIMKCDVDIRKDLFAHIVLAGGSTMFSGIGERLEKAITPLAPPATKVNVLSHPLRQDSAWIGGTLAASIYGVESSVFISKAAYDESGPSIVNGRCY
jgi:actin